MGGGGVVRELLGGSARGARQAARGERDLVDVGPEGTEGEVVGAVDGEEVWVYGVVCAFLREVDRAVVGPGSCVQVRGGRDSYGRILGSER